MRVFGLSRFLAHFSVFWAHRSLRLHISKTKQATRAVLHIPDNFTHNILIVKISHLGSRFGGYNAPKSVSEAKISKLTLFRAAPATKRLDPEVQWWFYFVRQWTPLPDFKRPLQYCRHEIEIAPPPKKFDPHFRPIPRGRGQIFAFIIRGRPRPVREKILATVPWPTSRK